LSAKNIEKSLKDSQGLELSLSQNQKSCDHIFSSIERSEYTVLLNNFLSSKKSQNSYSSNGYVFNRPSLKRSLIKNLTKLSPAISGQRLKQFKSRVLEGYKYKAKSYFESSLAYIYLQSLKMIKVVFLKLSRQRDFIFTKPRNFLNLASSPDFSVLRKLTYATRSLRFDGYSTANIRANNVVANLERSGLLEESKALKAILSDSMGIEVFKYLEERRIQLKKVPTFTFESDFETVSAVWNDTPKISIIVSSYNATSKMEVFLKRLSLCPELLDGTAEILLIDANSETPDSDIAVKIANRIGIALRSIRVHRRITIQEAWNFGITKAHGEYLTFLGVDETIYPSALTDLAANLDLEQTVDWVMANSIVTEVESDGQFIRDVMKYDRRDADLASPFLETCYVSYVAGMYRRNIHERFGYYDPTFRGAGDTEFKSRVLPSLKVSYLDVTLGEFLNYPEVRTTATERIELEDIRAWYAFRTPGGLKYQASLAGDGFLESLGRAALGYRKSYCEHISTDMIIASAVLQAVKSGEFSVSNGLLMELENANQQLKSMRVFLGYGPSKIKSLSVKQYLSLVRWFDIEGRKSAINGVRRMRLDNMFEQHMWYW
jgi:glycosyltransferase involved in cell wall biosynthesis